MADEQVIIDISVDAKDVEEAASKVDELTKSIEELSNLIKSARKQNNEFKKQQRELNKEYESGKISVEQYEKQTDELNKKIQSNNKLIAETSIELSNQKRERTANLKLAKSEVGTLNALRAKRNLLNKEIGETNVLTEEGKNRYKELEKELKKINEDINEAAQGFGNFKENIGNYTESINKSILGTDEFIEKLSEVPGAAGGAGSGIQDLIGTFKLLLANPVVLLISAIVGSLTLLFNAFKKSATGSRLLAKASAAVSGAFGAITKIAEFLAKEIVNLFENPLESIKSFGQSIVDNIFNRFKAIPAILKTVGKAFKSLLTLNIEELKEAAKDAGNEVIQMVTGVSVERQRELAQAFAETTRQAASFAEQMVMLNEQQFQARQNARFLERDIANLSSQFEFLSATADDSTISMLKQKEAAREAGNVAVSVAMKEQELAKQQLDLINAELKLRQSFGEDVQDLLDKQLEAELNLLDAQVNATETQRANAQQQREIQRDITEQRLDILIDGADKQKTINENIISSDRLSLEEKRKLLRETENLLTGSYNAQLAEVRSYVNDFSELQDLINETDAVQLQKRIENLGANEIISARILEIVKERKQAIRDFAEIDEELTTEEIERKKKAGAEIESLEKDKTVFLLEQQIKRLENQENTDAERIELQKQLSETLIDFEKQRLDVQLQDTKLTEEERQALILNSELEILKIKSESQAEQQEKDAANAERVKKSIEEIGEITKEFAGESAGLFSDLARTISEVFEDGAISAQEAIYALSATSNAIFNSINAKRDEQLIKLESQKEKELQLAGDNEKAQLEIEKKFEEESAKIKLKQFQADKANALIQIAINTAVEVSKSLSKPLLAIAVGALGAIQAGIVASKQPPEFGKGGKIVDIGNSHASGNDITVFGQTKDGQTQTFGKVERGEFMQVFSKKDTNKLLSNRFTQQFSRENNFEKRKFADGGTIVNNNSQNIQVPSAQDIAKAVSGIKIVAKIEDITEAANNKIEIQSNSTI